MQDMIKVGGSSNFFEEESNRHRNEMGVSQHIQNHSPETPLEKALPQQPNLVNFFKMLGEKLTNPISNKKNSPVYVKPDMNQNIIGLIQQLKNKN
jgi:hypothetical protein